VLIEEELPDFFNVAFPSAGYSMPSRLLSSSSKVANLSLFFFDLPVTDSTALEAHPVTLFLLGFSFSLSLSPMVLTLPVRFLDARDVGREEGLLSSCP
jgi:hypothetical protein